MEGRAIRGGGVFLLTLSIKEQEFRGNSAGDDHGCWVVGDEADDHDHNCDDEEG